MAASAPDESFEEARHLQQTIVRLDTKLKERIASFT